MSNLTLKELRMEYERAKGLYLATNDIAAGLYLDSVARELDRRIAAMKESE